MERVDHATVLSNEDVTEIIAQIPSGHRHLRTTIVLADGSALTLQEATVAAIVRAYVAVKTDPLRSSISLKGRYLPERKRGFAEWQLLEDSDPTPPPPAAPPGSAPP